MQSAALDKMGSFRTFAAQSTKVRLGSFEAMVRWADCRHSPHLRKPWYLNPKLDLHCRIQARSQTLFSVQFSSTGFEGKAMRAQLYISTMYEDISFPLKFRLTDYGTVAVVGHIFRPQTPSPPFLVPTYGTFSTFSGQCQELYFDILRI